MKKNMKKLAVGFGVFVMAVGSLMGCSSLGSGGNEQGEILKELPERLLCDRRNVGIF